MSISKPTLEKYFSEFSFEKSSLFLLFDYIKYLLCYLFSFKRIIILSGITVFPFRGSVSMIFLYETIYFLLLNLKGLFS